MCGIWALFGFDSDLCHWGNSFKCITHRGPDAWRVECDNRIKNASIGFHRLAIVDGIYGMQPMKIHLYPKLYLLCNGELYNYKNLIQQYGFKYETHCDVEIILHLYAAGGIENVSKNIDGVFAFILVDIEKRKVFLSRDPYGVRPLFTLRSESGVLAVSSEAKGIINISKDIKDSKWNIEPFTPSTFEEYDLKDDGSAVFVRKEQYYKISEKPAFQPFIPYEKYSEEMYENVRVLFTEACRKRLMSDRRIGCMLSGGLDSSLVAALVVRLAAENNLPYKIQTFSVGMGDSPDILAARQVAEFIGSEHHEVLFTEQDIAEVLDEVIYHLETPDITTIRASVGMYIISKYIKEKTDTTVVFSGEGADEVAQGYIYFRDAPSAEEGHIESLRLLKDIYMFDGLRADRTTSAFSLELRVPFLDQQFTNYYLNLQKELKQPQKGVEKHLLRLAFDKENLIPQNILWRHKEAFSDGVTSKKKSLFTILQNIIDQRMPNDKLETAAKKYPQNTPKTKESLYYREVFEKSYRNQSHFVPYYWMPKWINVTDPSARFISHYAADKKEAALSETVPN